MVSLLYLPAHWFWMLALVNLTQAAMLAPLVPLSDALALSWSRSTTRNNSGAFEYGWVRGTGSAAFMAGSGPLLDKRWALSGWLQLFGSLPRVFLEQHCRRDLRLNWHRARMQPVRSARSSTSEIGWASCANLHLYAWCSRPPSFSAATPCMMRSQ